MSSEGQTKAKKRAPGNDAGAGEAAKRARTASKAETKLITAYTKKCTKLEKERNSELDAAAKGLIKLKAAINKKFNTDLRTLEKDHNKELSALRKAEAKAAKDAAKAEAKVVKDAAKAAKEAAKAEAKAAKEAAKTAKDAAKSTKVAKGAAKGAKASKGAAKEKVKGKAKAAAPKGASKKASTGGAPKARKPPSVKQVQEGAVVKRRGGTFEEAKMVDGTPAWVASDADAYAAFTNAGEPGTAGPEEVSEGPEGVDIGSWAGV